MLWTEKQELIQLTNIMEQQIQGFSEFGISEEDLPISTTSIRFRLERMQ